MDALKKFLSKKKTDKVFKTAGPGHKLADSTTAQQQGHGSKSPGRHPQSTGSSGQSQGHRVAATPSEEKRAAAAAALARVEKSRKPEANSKDLLAARQLAFIKDQARKEIEAEKKTKELQDAGLGVGGQSQRDQKSPERIESFEREARVFNPETMAVSGVYFTCPLIGPEVLSRSEIEENIKEFLLDQPEEELGVTSCLLIYSCNKPRDKITGAVDTLCKYLDNIINTPNDPKFQRIRCSNRVFQEKVLVVVGAEQFLVAAGFRRTMMKADPSADQEEEFWVFSSKDDPETYVAHLTELRDTLKQTTPILPELDRNIQVLMPAQAKKRQELPEEFFSLTIDEVKRQQILKTEQLERDLTLRTKEMRERDEAREQRMYRYCIIRIRFPDGFTLQGTFRASEKVSNLHNFVSENLVTDSVRFELRKSGGDYLTDMDSTLAEMHLPPSSVLNFKVESAPPQLASGEISYLKPEILALVQNLE